MKVFKLILIAAALLAVVMYISTLLPSQTIHIVRFNSMGGSPLPNQYIKDNHYVVRPEDPIKENCHFIGWYKDIDYQEKYVFFNTKVTDNITLYAQWELI